MPLTRTEPTPQPHPGTARPADPCRAAAPPPPAGYGPAGPARRALAALLSNGWTEQAISDRTGLGTDQLRAVHRAVWAHRHLTGQLQRLAAPEGARPVPALGSRRRLQALAAIGWDPIDLAARCGTTWAAFAGDTVDQSTAETARRLYDTLCASPAPGPAAAAVRAAATRRGWASPLAWDDGQLDDPHATALPRATVRTRGDGAGQVRALRETGLSDLRIADLLGVQPATVTRRVRRAENSARHTTPPRPAPPASPEPAVATGALTAVAAGPRLRQVRAVPSPACPTTPATASCPAVCSPAATSPACGESASTPSPTPSGNSAYPHPPVGWAAHHCGTATTSPPRSRDADRPADPAGTPVTRTAPVTRTDPAAVDNRSRGRGRAVPGRLRRASRTGRVPLRVLQR